MQTIETLPVDEGYRDTLRVLLAESDTEVEIEVSASHGSGTVYVDVAGAGPVALDVDRGLSLLRRTVGDAPVHGRNVTDDDRLAE